MRLLIMAFAAITMAGCGSKNSDMTNNNKIFPKGQKAAANFTGTAWVEMLVTDGETFNTQVYNVTFEPDCRNNRGCI
ncbi:hypothetical protein [uncultured Alistipes sp.]|uniref:hypothetical protein n=1 Tax=uncultured Alistipes sp. TaxID=538949 RepID=UPI0025E1E573|nr:hypothetical protein [uncultured Alistipes sp.]